MSLKSKIEAVIYASDEPVTLPQLVGLLTEEVQGELHRIATLQSELPLGQDVAMDPATDASTLGEASLREGTLATPGADGQPPPELNAGRSGESENASSLPPVSNEQPEQAVGPTEVEKRQARERERAVREYLRRTIDELMRDYTDADRGIEVREVAGGFRMGTKPEYHDAVRGFVKSLAPVLKLSLQALETLAVVAYKQPVTAAEISDIRGVDSAGVLGGLMTRKLIATSGRKQVIGRPMLYKTTKEFLVRFGLKDVQELPSMEEFERMAGELAEQEDLPMESAETLVERANARGDAEHVREATDGELGSADAASTAELDESTSEVDDFSDEQPSEEIVAEVLGVSQDRSGAVPVSEPGRLDRAEQTSATRLSAESTSLDPAQGIRTTTAPPVQTRHQETRHQEVTQQDLTQRDETQPIEAVAAMQAEQTSALAPPLSSPASGTGSESRAHDSREREPQ